MDSPSNGPHDVGPASFPFEEDFGKMQLTSEELKILKECNKESIGKRGIPFAVGSGVIAHLLGKQKKILNHAKYGTIPLVIFSTFSGYFVGKLSYFSVCHERLMNVPDGAIRQRMTRRFLGIESPQVAGAPVQMDPRTYAQSRPTDIDTLGMSNFDTMPSNLDSDTPRLPGGLSTESPQRFTSYNDLREKNRREYMEKMHRSAFPQTQPAHSPQPGYPPEQPEYPPQQPSTQFGYTGEPIVPPGSQIPMEKPTYQRRPRVPGQLDDPATMPTQNSGPIPRRIKTKYGDDWE